MSATKPKSEGDEYQHGGQYDDNDTPSYFWYLMWIVNSCSEKPMLNEDEFMLDFPDVSVADANRYCEDLRTQLLDADETIRVERMRRDETTMDFGATLAVVLGAPATVALAKALISWTKRNNAANLKVVTRN